MNIYRISQEENCGYDTFSDAVVLAESAEQAAQTHPDGYHLWDPEREDWYTDRAFDGSRSWGESTWSRVKHVKVELLGIADERFVTMNAAHSRIVCASFHAG